MPVRSSVYTYSPSSSESSASAAASKYSSILPTASSLSYGQYRPFKSGASSGLTSSADNGSRSASFRSSPSRYGADNADSTTTTRGTGRTFGRYNLPSSYTSSSYSPTSSAYLSSSSSLNSSASSSSSSPSSSSVSTYKPISSLGHTNSFSSPSSRYIGASSSSTSGANCSPSTSSSTASSPAPRYSLSASSNSSLSSGSGEHHSSTTKYGQYKSPSSSSSLTSSAYSSGSSLPSSANNNYSASSYVPKGRRLSHTYKLTIGQRICCCCYPPFCATMSGARDDTDDLDDKLECISPTPSTHSYRSPSPPVSKQSAAAAARSSGVPTATPPKSAALKNNYETQEPPSLTAATATTDTNDYTNNLNDQYCIDTPLEWKSYNSPGSLTSRLSSSRHETPASSSITGSYLSSSIGTGTSHASTTSARTLGESDGPLPADVPSGLINMGNTCYMNATLQSLYSIESIRNQLLSSSSSSLAAGGDKVLTRELCNLFKQMKGSNGGGSTTSSYGQGKYGSTEVSPAAFKFEFARYQSKFSGFGQQDAQEFLRYLINGVHEESNLATKRTYRRSGASSGGSAPKTSQEAWSQYRDIVDDSPLVDLLVGQLCSTITCGQCQNKSHCWDPFWDLSLPLPMSRRSGTFSIRDVINEFTSAETLDSDERPSCAKCNKPTRSTKQISLARLPPVLILHLKKFTNDGYKLTNPDISIDKQLTFNGVNYKLKACISHHGMSSSSGHYTSLCEYSTRWYHFDDARVRDVTSKFDSTKLREAYVLFYTKSGSGATTSTTTTSRPTTPTTTTTTTTTAARRPSSSLVSSHSKL